MSWSYFVNRYGELGFKILETLAGFAHYIVSPLNDFIDVPDAVDNPLASAVLEAIKLLFGNLSLIEVVVGGGIILFVIITLVKWGIGIIT